MSDRESIRCFNPITGKQDGGYCSWEGKGKCLNCQAEDLIEKLEAENARYKNAFNRLKDAHTVLEVLQTASGDYRYSLSPTGG